MNTDKETEVKQTPNTNENKASFSNSVQGAVKKFEVEIYDKISYGEPPMEQIKLEKVKYDKPVIIEAKTKKDLDDFAASLALCKQTFKIIRVIDETPEKAPEKAPDQKLQSVKDINQQENNQNNTQQNKSITLSQLRPIRFYKIGDIEVKEDNGKIYQKQWVKLSESEASNLRIVNDKTNAIVNLNGKHIELKKWILVENTDIDDSTVLEGCLK